MFGENIIYGDGTYEISYNFALYAGIQSCNKYYTRLPYLIMILNR